MHLKRAVTGQGAFVVDRLRVAFGERIALETE
jgi:hypothetical protein